MTKKRLIRRNPKTQTNLTTLESTRQSSKTFHNKTFSALSTTMGKVSIETTHTVPIIDGRNRTGSQAVTYFIAGSLLLVALYIMGKQVYAAIKNLLVTYRKPHRQESKIRRVSRKESSAKLMSKQDKQHTLEEI